MNRRKILAAVGSIGTIPSIATANSDNKRNNKHSDERGHRNRNQNRPKPKGVDGIPEDRHEREYKRTGVVTDWECDEHGGD